MMLRAIAWYQSAFSWRPSPCRFYPSCSNYAMEAIEVHGARTGALLTLRRLGRCRPFGGSGIDLVPEVAGTGSHSDTPCSQDSDHQHSMAADAGAPPAHRTSSPSKERQS